MPRFYMDILRFQGYSASMLLDSEIAEEYPVEGKEVLTPSGWKPVRKVYKTVPLPVWVLSTPTRALRASGHHLVRSYRQAGDTEYRCHQIRFLKPGDWIETEDGAEKIVSVEETGEVEEMYDITVDSEDGLFYSDGIVSHNSTTMVTRQLMMSYFMPKYKSLYVVPYHEQLKTYADRYLEMERAFRVNVGKQNKYDKTYANESKVDMHYALTDASKIRGKTVTECVDVNATVFVYPKGFPYRCECKLKDVKKGDRIHSFYGNIHMATWAEVTAYIPKGVRPVVEVVTDHGQALKVTKEHQFYIGYHYSMGSDFSKAWKCAKDLKPGDTIHMCSCRIGMANTFPVRIVSIEPAGEIEVADISVEGTHAFVANDLCVHNCVIDECQNMDPNLVPEILYTMTTSKLATTVYAGTALTVDTLLEEQWQKSSLGMWNVRDGTGRGWLNMYDKETLWKVCDSPYGPRCPITKKPLNMTDGCFVHYNPQALESGNIGIHVPQCIIPDFAKDPIQWGRIYNNVKTQDARKVLQECFGIAVAEGARELTETDLLRICVIEESEDELLRRSQSGYYATVISGCDWGGSDYNPATKTKTSYTAHCIIGLAPDGFVDILHFKKYSGMGYAQIADDIVADHRRWNARAIASDFGVGAFYNTELRRHIPLGQHFVLGYVGPKAAPFAPAKESSLPYHFSVNRNEAISRVFTDVKSQPMRMIRARKWDITKEYLTDWLNVYRSLKELQSGEKTFLYIRQATKPDDCLHAFTFAYMLMRLFKGEPIVQDLSVLNHVRSVLGAPTAAIAATRASRSVFSPQDYIVSG